MLSELNIGMGVAALAAQIVVGLMFVVGGLTKLMRWRELRGIVRGYRLLHSALVPLAVALLPPVELLVGANLIVGVAAPWSPLSAASLLVIFAAAMAINLRRGRTEIDCGCFGATLRQRLDWRMVWLNLFLAILLLGSAVSAAPVTSQLWVAALPAGIVLFILYLALNATWALDASRRRVFS